MTTTQPQPYTPENVKVMFSDEQIQIRLDELAEEINATYQGSEQLTLICILKGGFMFLSELSKRITVPCQIEFVRLSSYGNNHKSSGTVKPVDLTLPRLNDKDVLLIEDIIDTGLTLNFFMEYLESVHTPKSLRLAVLLDKVEARQVPVEVDFKGFDVDNKYVIGFGLDDAGLYRNLPYIGYFD